RVCRHDECRALEVAVPVVLALGLVVEVHGDGSVGHESIRVEASPAPLQYAAVHLRASKVQVCSQGRFIRRRLGNAPGFLQHHQTATFF
ncbi:unnamed protein product, partial [Musa acuminata subsp. malaccensis]|uniref:(wild Malaysian banana) hypothetical protein n=1 Tax=Musa acuminata subsp. malaccensis TaxID=214687 RepID=A0A804K0B6_MUSAM